MYYIVRPEEGTLREIWKRDIWSSSDPKKQPTEFFCTVNSENAAQVIIKALNHSCPQSDDSDGGFGFRV